MISHFIHLLLSMWFLLLVSTLHTLVVATLEKPQTSFAVVKNNLLLTEYAWNLNTLRKSPIGYTSVLHLLVTLYLMNWILDKDTWYVNTSTNVYLWKPLINYRGVRASVKKFWKKSETIWNAWKDVLFNALKIWQQGFVKSKKVWNHIKIWILTSL